MRALIIWVSRLLPVTTMPGMTLVTAAACRASCHGNALTLAPDAGKPGRTLVPAAACKACCHLDAAPSAVLPIVVTQAHLRCSHGSLIQWT
jgi:hypothetical protein